MALRPKKKNRLIGIAIFLAGIGVGFLLSNTNKTVREKPEIRTKLYVDQKLRPAYLQCVATLGKEVYADTTFEWKWDGQIPPVLAAVERFTNGRDSMPGFATGTIIPTFSERPFRGRQVAVTDIADGALK